MENKKQENLDRAKKIWDLFQKGNSKKNISTSLEINRTEVSNVIKYTTPDMYETTAEVEKNDILISKLNDQIKELQEKINTHEKNILTISETKDL